VEPGCSHLVALQASGRKPPLFCFPGGGGEVFDFTDMATLIGERRSIYVVNISSIYESRPNCDVKQLAAFCCQVIRSNQENGPYYLCGYSFGGVVAYEIAAILANEGDEIGLLALVDSVNPALQSCLSTSEAVRFRATYVADRLGKYARNLLRGRIDIFMIDALASLRSRLDSISWLLVQSASRTLRRPAPKALQFTDYVRVAACRDYDPTPYGKRLVLIRSAEREPEYGIESTLGWGRCATGRIDVHVVAGDHWSMMARPQVDYVVEKLITYLDNIHR
jgi:thioesterase domain-containing protein